MVTVQPVDVPRRPVAELTEVIGMSRLSQLLAEAAELRGLLGSRVIWTFSSTASGGGVAELLHGLVGYVRDLAIDIRWTVIGGDGDFFRITKRLHNRIHGQPGDGGGLGPDERAHYESVLAANAELLQRDIKPGDVVLLHDPQTAGLVQPFVDAGAYVVWRSHIGIDWENELSRSAWDFLYPFLKPAHAFVFTRRAYVPPMLRDAPVWIIPPSIDPFSPKNQYLSPETVRAMLTQVGLIAGSADARACCYTRRDGGPGVVRRAASIAAEGLPGPDDPLVVQVSRWDRLKDMLGVMRGFAAHVAAHGPGWLVLAGPAVDKVDDDPEGAIVFADCLGQWRQLPPLARSRVVLATIPMIDVDENAAMINSLQRHAHVVTQKSLAEGFGLTVAEAMWKARPVVGSAVGGIQDQILEGAGVLIHDPTDLTAFGHAVRGLLDDAALARSMGLAGQNLVRTRFVGDVHLLRYADLVRALLTM